VGLTCTPIIDVSSLIQPLMLRSVFKGEEFSLDAIIDVILQDKISESLLGSVELPSEFADLGDVICLQIEMTKVKNLLAAMRGEAVEAGAGLDKIIELIVNLQMLSSISSAFGT